LILTITLNPAVDVNYKMNSFSLDTVNRVDEVSKTAGGKGLNVARVLHQLNEEVATTGFLGGSLGDFIRREITTLGLQDYFIEISEDTRNCIAVIHNGKQTEILEAGPKIKEDEANIFLEKFADFIQKVTMITISGSLPKGLPSNFYVKLLEIAEQYETPVLLDTNGTLLAKTLSEHKPLLIKPNEQELGDFLQKKLEREEDIIASLYSEQLVDIPWVVVTLGESGAIVKHRNNIYKAIIPKVDAINPVGSGDSVIAGFAAGFSRNLLDDQLIKFALTMGVLNALEDKTGHINPKKIESIMGQIEVEKIRSK